METPSIVARRFLFVLWEGGGSVPPTLGLAKRLIERGHKVRVISDLCNELEVRAAGCEFTAYSKAPNRIEKSAANTLIRDYEDERRITALRKNLKVFLDPGYAQDVLAELAERPVDVCIVNDLLMGALFAPEKAGIPAVMLMPQRLYTRIPAPGVNLLGKARASFQELMFQRVLFTEAFNNLQSTRNLLGLAPLQSFFAYLNQLPRILIMTSPAFDFKARPAPNMLYIGPMLDDPAWAEPFESPWPADHPDPLVVVGLSTAYQQQEALLQNVIDALGKLPVRGLVTLGPSLDHAQFHIPENVVLRRSVPHGQIFPLASAVVTHSGHGTVIRALAHGLPLVCIPFGGDQDGNARRVVALGAGLQLDKRADVTRISEAISSVVNESTFREHAQRLSKVITEDARNSIGVQELERIAALSGKVPVTA